MKPTIEGFEIIKTQNGYGVTTIYDLFSLNIPKLVYETETYQEAKEYKQLALSCELSEYERCKQMGCSYPYND